MSYDLQTFQGEMCGGYQEVNHVAIFPHVIWLYLITKAMVGQGGWGRNKGKMSPHKKFMQMTDPRVRL